MRASAPALLLLLVVCAGCGPTVDLATSLQVQDSSTGWFDLGVVNGQNKLVPSITFSLKNNSDQKLSTLQVNALFRRVTEKDEWGSGFLTAAGSSGLAPGAATPPLTIRSQLGYTGSEQSREDMLRNTHFVDATVELFAKYGSAQWKRIGQFPVTRRLITK
ncbi:MAG: hypothetical protein ABJA98_16960 [Acidobacteriota bacterium]